MASSGVYVYESVSVMGKRERVDYIHFMLSAFVRERERERERELMASMGTKDTSIAVWPSYTSH